MTTRQRIPELDVLRFAAACSVVAFHYEILTIPGTRLASIVSALGKYGFLGVPLFFMISGFVVLWTASGRTPAEFIIARITRLYPSYWVCVIATSVVLLAAGRAPGLEAFAVNLSMIHSLFGVHSIDPVYWTLFVELKFYALVFLVMIFGQIDAVYHWLAAWLGVTAVSTFTQLSGRLSLPLLDVVTFQGSAAFFISGCTAFLIRKDGPRKRYLAMYLLSMVVSLTAESRIQFHYTQQADFRTVFDVSVFVLLFHGLVLSAALRPDSLPKSRIWYWMGSITYPLYLIHAIAGKTLFFMLPSSWALELRLGILILIVFAFSALLGFSIEQHGCSILYRYFSGLLRGRKASREDLGTT